MNTKNTKIQKLEKPLILISIIVFGWIFLYYAIVNPVIPYHFDDWRYFGFFESDPIPRLGRWNITRILPEYLLPLTGYLTAFIIYPLVGDYLASAGIALAILMALALTAFFIAVYRLFHVLCDNSALCTFVSSMMMLLCFAIFKHSPGAENVHMFFADTYNLYFFYVFPNILNSIVVFMLAREIILYKNLSIGSENLLKSGVLLIGIYFCIFSMLFSAGILLSFAVSVIIIRFFSAFQQKHKFSEKIKNFFIDLIKNYNMVLFIVSGMGMAMILELQSGRSNADWETIYTGSVFSMDFIRRIAISAKGLIGQIGFINKYILFIMLFIIFMTLIFCFKRKDQQNPVIRLALICFIPLVFLSVFYSMIAAKAGTDRTELNYCIYGVFFFGVLLISLLSLYLLQEISYSHMFFPFVSVIMIMIIFNSTRWPYASFHAAEKAKVMNQVISCINEASELGCKSIELYVPDDFPLPLWATSRLSHTLYFHNITSTKVTIQDVKCSTDDSFYYMVK